MISLDQVYLLEEKVESAVAKIQQLQAENDALRSKCLELTNALSSKSEQLTTFENDQDQIEDGIKKALERLNSIENSVLKAAAQVASSTPVTAPVVTPVKEAVEPVKTTVPSFDAMETVPESENEIIEEEPVIEDSEIENPDEEISIPVETPETTNAFTQPPVDNFNRAIDRAAFADLAFDNPTPTESFEPEETFADDENQDGLGFDIF